MDSHRHHNRRGFTLIELLVVVAIISILSSLIFASLNSARMKARDAKRYSDLHQVQLALELYRQTNGSYPATNPLIAGGWHSVCPVGGSFTTTGSSGYIPNLAPTYIGTLPTEPLGCVGGAIKGYIYRSNGTDYKFSTDWTTEIGTYCISQRKFWDPARDVSAFCSIYTPGAAAW